MSPSAVSTVGRRSFLVGGLVDTLWLLELASFRFGLRLRVCDVGGWCLIVLSSSFVCCGSPVGFWIHFGTSSSAALSVICERLRCCCGSPSRYVLVGRWYPSSVSTSGLLAVASFQSLSRSQRRCSGRLADGRPSGTFLLHAVGSVMLAGCPVRLVLVRDSPAETDTEWTGSCIPQSTPLPGTY